MRSSGLQGLSVLHQGLYCEGVQRSGKPLMRALVAHDHGQCHNVPRKVGIHAHHPLSLFPGLLGRGMGRMAFLPEELSGAEEEPRAHFPADHVAPLVAQDGKVPPRMYPVLVGIPYNCFRSGPDHKFLFEPGIRIHHHAGAVGIGHQPVMRNHGAFLGESLHMLRFPAQEGLWYEKREISVLHARFLEHTVQDRLHLFPYGIAIGLDYHAAPHGRLFGQVRLHHKVVIPLRIIIQSARYLFCHVQKRF